MDPKFVLKREKIEALAATSSKVPALLSEAGAAIQLLSDPSPPNVAPGSDRKALISAHVQTFNKCLREVYEELNAQVDALESAGIIFPNQQAAERLGPGINKDALKSLNMGWLNSRTKDLALAKEAELVQEAIEFLEKLPSASEGEKMEEGS
ncbi:hypothetical protein EJ06DRAFT_522231 [Trichodelitschia bisporula]|uniref:Mediator of RNA polymerase II transcription subunit 11 n=1 Tax=Trichodelitschia bisporula TaxID=703511 RepID=A0A6G1HWE3_9PEZI|nr:hypothetical protein EJ06DRAFT_522231 [Trichodelitschia bisporula]